MSAETVLTVCFVLWTFVTGAIYLAYRVDVGARRDAWEQIERERAELRVAWQRLEDERGKLGGRL